MMRSKRLKVGLVFGACAMIGVGWTWINRSIETARVKHFGAVDIVGWNLSKEYSDRATDSFSAQFKKMGRSKVPTEHFRDIIIYYLSEADRTKALTWSGIEVRSIRKESMRYTTEPAYNGFTFTISGMVSGKDRPRIMLDGREVALDIMNGFDEVWDSAPDARDRFSLEAENIEPLKGLVSKAFAKAFSPTGDENVRQVNVTPAPIFQKDYYFQGKWCGTYATWEKQPDFENAKTEKIRN